MRSLISEFSFGFALTRELVDSLGSLSAAPIFPSLLEEGRAGGGYDVKLEAPGIPLFIQFKRSECLKAPNSRELKAGAALDLPYYRITITGRADSDQHRYLLELDRHPNIVLYAAPMFHQKEEFDEAFASGQVRGRSFYVRPRDIGAFGDDRAHHVSFDGATYWRMSEPKEIEGLGLSELEAMLSQRLRREERPLRATLPEALAEAEAAIERAREPVSSQIELPHVLRGPVSREVTSVEEFRRRQSAALSSLPEAKPDSDPALGELRRLADIGLRDFNSLLFVVQAGEFGL